jgi:hypothetical protein
VRLSFEGTVFEWRGPAPYYFVRVPDEIAARIREVAAMVTYGWGVIPCIVTIGSTSGTTSLFPKDGGYLVPVKNALRLPERLALNDTVDVTIEIVV